MKLNFTTNKLFFYLSLLISGIVFYFVFLKANNTSFTHDESFTYLHYVHMDFLDILSFKHPYTNNHILNTLLIKYSEKLFGSSEIALRTPSLLALLIYFIYSIKLLISINKNLVILFFCFMIFNPYLLEFFALARGYGLSISFMIMGLYYFLNYLKINKTKDGIIFHIACLLAILSNFSLLNFYVASLITFNLIKITESIITKKTFQFFKINKIHFICLSISFIILFEPIRRLSNLPALDFGGKDGFIKDTVVSIINTLLYNTTISNTLITVFAYSLSILFLLVFLFILKNVIKRNLEFVLENSRMIALNFILLLCALANTAQHYFLNNDYFNGRFALFFYPLFTLNLILVFDYIYRKQFKSIIISISLISSILLMINLYTNYNPNYYYDWHNDIDTKKIMKTLVEDHQKENKNTKSVTLGVNWLFEPVTNFYRVTWDLKWLNETNRNGISQTDDYYCIFKNDTNAYTVENKLLLFSSKNSNAILIKND